MIISKFGRICLTEDIFNFIYDSYNIMQKYNGEVLGSFSLSIGKNGYLIRNYRRLAYSEGYSVSFSSFQDSDHLIAHSHPNLSSNPSLTDVRSLLKANSIYNNEVKVYSEELSPPRPVPFVIFGIKNGRNLNCEISGYLPTLKFNAKIKRLHEFKTQIVNLEFGKYYYCDGDAVNEKDNVIKSYMLEDLANFNFNQNELDDNKIFFSVGVIPDFIENQDLYLLNFITNKFKLRSGIVGKITPGVCILFKFECKKGAKLLLEREYDNLELHLERTELKNITETKHRSKVEIKRLGLELRTLPYFKAYNYNLDKIQECSILLVGVGNLGTRIANMLSKLPFKCITLIDHDLVGEENIGYQELYTVDDIGRKKVDAAGEKLKIKYPWVNVEARDLQVPDAILDSRDSHSKNILDKQFQALLELVDQSDVVIVSLDSATARMPVWITCMKLNKRFIDVGFQEYYGNVFVWVPGYRCPLCLTKFKAKNIHERTYYANPVLADIAAAVASQYAIDLVSGKIRESVYIKIFGINVETSKISKGICEHYKIVRRSYDLTEVMRDFYDRFLY